MGRDFIYLWESHSPGLFLRFKLSSPAALPAALPTLDALLPPFAGEQSRGPLSVGKKLEEEARLGSWVVPYRGGGAQQAGSGLRAAVCLRSCPSPWVVPGC